jgi:hypothetical protein
MDTGLLWAYLKERDHLEVLYINGNKILKWMLQEVGLGGVEWMHLTQYRDR